MNSGDHDMEVPYLGTQAWIRSLNYSLIDDWRPWMIGDQITGYYRFFCFDGALLLTHCIVVYMSSLDSLSLWQIHEDLCQ